MAGTVVGDFDMADITGLQSSENLDSQLAAHPLGVTGYAIEVILKDEWRIFFVKSLKDVKRVTSGFRDKQTTTVDIDPLANPNLSR